MSRCLSSSRRRGCRRSRRGLAGLALALALALAPVARPGATGLGPQDMAAMMQGMMAMMKLWNAFMGGGDLSLGGSFSPSTAQQGSQWADPWTGMAAASPWSTPGAGMPGAGAPWSSPPRGGAPWGGAPGAGPWPPGPGQGLSAPGAGSVPGGGPGLSRPPAGAPTGPGPGGRPTARAGGPLEGRWTGDTGDTVEFRGERFRLGAQGRGQITGTFLIHNDRLVLYVPEGDATRLYRFERRGEYLALQDDSGQVLLFRAGR